MKSNNTCRYNLCIFILFGTFLFHLSMFSMLFTIFRAIYIRLMSLTLRDTEPGKPCTRPLAVQHLDNHLYLQLVTEKVVTVSKN